MLQDLTLSQRLQAQIEIIDREEEHIIPGAREVILDLRRRIKSAVEDIVQSRYFLGGRDLKGVEPAMGYDPEFAADDLNDHFTRVLLGEIPGYVDRILTLSRLAAILTPSSITNGYLQEATRSYILGLAQASVALSRATLEQALKERLARQGSGEFRVFQDLLAEARNCNLLDKIMENCVREIANAANEVMHEKPTDLHKALDILIKLRGVLQHLYSVECGISTN